MIFGCFTLYAASRPSQLNQRVPRLRLVQAWSSAGMHGCKLRSRGTRIIKVDESLGRYHDMGGHIEGPPPRQRA